MTLKYLGSLGQADGPLDHAALLSLSGLPDSEIAGFGVEWASLDRSRRREILARLAELSDDNLDLDFSAVMRACLPDEDDAVRQQATRGLWECEDRVIIGPLVSLLTNDPALDVRSAAAVILGKFASMAQEGKLIQRDSGRIFDALLDTVNRPYEQLEVRRRALEAVANFDDPAVDDLIEAAYYDGSPELKQSAIFAMGRTSNSQWLPMILVDVDDEVPAIRFEAANACGLLGDESTVPHLLALIEDEDFQVQSSAIEALGSIGGAQAKQALLECTDIEDEELEEVVQAALKAIEFDEDPLGVRLDV
jgi:HEAT repeat protein